MPASCSVLLRCLLGVVSYMLLRGGDGLYVGACAPRAAVGAAMIAAAVSIVISAAGAESARSVI